VQLLGGARVAQRGRGGLEGAQLAQRQVLHGCAA
jgi:hypothetical protein